MSGEYKVSMPAVFSQNLWQHSMTPEKFEIRESMLFRPLRNEFIKGVILYADVTDKSIELSNINAVINTFTPCWPNPVSLRTMLDRHEVMKICGANGFVDHGFYQTNNLCSESLESNYGIRKLFGVSGRVVVKSGNVHRGEGKYLISQEQPFPDFEGTCTIEPYFEGISIRSLIIGDETFGIRIENEQNWIKNTEGAEIYEYTLSKEIIDHSREVARYFGLDVAGVDYIINKDGFHFLEINQYPGVSGFDDIMNCAKKFFISRMKEMECNIKS